MTEVSVNGSRNPAARRSEASLPLLLLLTLVAALAVAGQSHAARDLTVSLAAPTVVEDNVTFALDLSAFNTGSGAGSQVEIQLYLDGNTTAPAHNVGNLANGEYGNVSETFTLACGVYTFSATVDPSDGVPETDETNNNATLVVVVVPFINITSNLSGSLGAYNLSLNASASHGCEPLTFNWTIDGETFTGPLVTYFPLAGSLAVNLTVRSASNQTFSNSLSISLAIPNAPPTLLLSPSSLSIQTLQHTLLVLNAQDADGIVASYFVDFGDGNNTTVLADVGQYEYRHSGDFTLSVRVLDNLGANATANISVQVANRPPIVDVETFWVSDAGSAVPFNASASHDPEGGPVTFAWTFGDGATGTGATPNHTYANPGTYTATVMVTDGEGAAQNATITVRIEPGSSPTGSFPWIWILILVLLTALVLFMLMRRRKDDDEADKAEAKSSPPPGSDDAKKGEGSSSKPPSP